jgi:hypothetical protein
MRAEASSLPLAATAAIALTAIGLIVWIAADPQYWFPGAYAAKGGRGDVGPRGPRGPVGPQGPVGDTAEGAIADLDSRVSDLEDSIGTLQTDLSDLQDETGGSTIESDVQDATSKLDAICTALSGYSGALEDIYISAC